MRLMPEPPVWSNDLLQRLTSRLHEQLRGLPPPPAGQRWSFDVDMSDGEDGTTTVAATARLAPVIRIENADRIVSRRPCSGALLNEELATDEFDSGRTYEVCTWGDGSVTISRPGPVEC